jgi:hypothetical protein
MNNDDAVVRRLDLILATLQLAFESELDAARARVSSDPVSKAILDHTEDWIASTELQKKVAAKAKVSDRTVRDRLPDLVRRRILESGGSEARPTYRRTGLV